MKWENNFLPKKITIRLSILTIVLSLLVGISGLIISINYFALDSVLIAAAKHSIHHAGGKVSEQIKAYFEPLNTNANIASHLLKNKFVKPENSSDFFKFLYSMIAKDPVLTAAYWGDASGDSYIINKSISDDSFVQTSILHGKVKNKSIKTTFGKQEKPSISNTELDPRTRPWYQKAKLKKQLVWSVYHFVAVGDQKQQMGISSSFPVYDHDGKLLGVFGMDMPIIAISNYISDIKTTKNSSVFVANNAGDVIAIHDAKSKNTGALTIANLNIPRITKSFETYHKDHQSPFIYSVNNKKHISSYEKIADIKHENPWFVSIVTPINDIIAPLRESILIALMFISLVLIFGIILASIFSSSLSRPIKKLARDANLICQLKMSKVKTIKSWIIEISEMNASFIKMKNALNSFQRYMPTALVKKLIASNKVAAVGGETKELTLIFTDIKDFTQMSENIRPKELMCYLSEYFQTITKIIIETNGTVDKYIGDGVMAFWGAPTDDPKHALHACQAVLKIQKALQKLNEKWRAENKPQATTRIGINTGNVVVGNVGSDDRLNYTLLGDTVTLADHLEELNKTYNTSVIVSESTFNKVKNNFEFSRIDKVNNEYIYELKDPL